MEEAFLTIVIKAVVFVFIVLTAFAYTMLLERKLLGRMQGRIGPNRAGPFGMMQPAADVVKMLFKEDFTPAAANRVVFQIAPVIAVMAPITTLVLIPYGGTATVFGHDITLYGTDLNVGLLFAFAMAAMGHYGLMLGGYASGNKYGLIGGARTAAQLVSYEVSMALSVVGVIMLSESLSLVDIVKAQQDTAWFIVFQPIGFIVFFITGIAETNRTPFDLPEAESELVAGYATEYGGTKYAGFAMAEYLNMIVVSALTVTLFLGGYSGPWLPEPLWFAIKVFIMILIFIWVRATMPRLRYDRLMKLGWKFFLPLATLNLLVTAVVVGLGFAHK